MNHSFLASQPQPAVPEARRPPIYHVPPPDEPPPSYEIATHSAASPLLVGPPPNYGTYSAYSEPEESSIASDDNDMNSRTLPEWVGQMLVVISFLAIIYGFWRLVNEPERLPG
ncbi:hypothetical protein EJ04DRAFT_567185 [Polyplosphaeria fusca]|uniref:Uncharacterized protein n=1 Tax=Polyplosphaeria fusca TaxID=682080 RepID=A0A9P4QUB6_9PLEO|nr:hypothetical protein EJ04DRAFT_567185 [Polyplosphaeria fusca]